MSGTSLKLRFRWIRRFSRQSSVEAAVDWAPAVALSKLPLPPPVGWLPAKFLCSFSDCHQTATPVSNWSGPWRISRNSSTLRTVPCVARRHTVPETEGTRASKGAVVVSRFFSLCSSRRYRHGPASAGPPFQSRSRLVRRGYLSSAVLLVVGWRLWYTWTKLGRTDAALYTATRFAIVAFYTVTVALAVAPPGSSCTPRARPSLPRCLRARDLRCLRHWASLTMLGRDLGDFRPGFRRTQLAVPFPGSEHCMY